MSSQNKPEKFFASSREILILLGDEERGIAIPPKASFARYTEAIFELWRMMGMSNIMFFCIPAHGHTNPTIKVVEELVKRGHRVRYFSFEEFREKIERAGAEYIGCEFHHNFRVQ